ncbi:hypothetical protein PoB_003943900 [Plakobranchus ocellatus]|uniref:Uncharacterized protein n=1 Tax=Plakobranchus ocellatus TaxID=259542 RepID=A0AAV4AYU3_9GAST|nr:hypothetical protein PoB_003943900 [Plakobranchus ocellatus]
MASMNDNQNPEEQERLLSKGGQPAARAIPTSTSSNNHGIDPKPRNPRTSKAPDQRNTFHQYERIDLDPLMPATDISPGGSDLISPSGSSNSEASKTPVLSDSEAEALHASLGKPVAANRPKDIALAPGQTMQPVYGRGAINSNERASERYAGSTSASDTTAAGRPTSQSAAPDRLYGYSLKPHNCQIRPGDSGVNGDSRTARASCKAPVPVPRSRLESPGTSTPQAQTSSQASTPSQTASQGAKDDISVVTKQPNKSNPSSGQTEGAKADNESASSKKSAKEKDKKAAKSSKDTTAELTSIPQTNFMIGLLVTCCFNPVLGIVAMVVSLRAAAAYRDGDNKKGACRARASIIISLISIMLTMLVVSTLLVYSAVDKHGYGRKKDNGNATPFGF